MEPQHLPRPPPAFRPWQATAAGEEPAGATAPRRAGAPPGPTPGLRAERRAGHFSAQPRKHPGRIRGPSRLVSECGLVSPAPSLRADRPAPGQSWRPGPKSGKIPRSPHAALRGRRRRRWGHAQRPRGSGGRESTLRTPRRPKLGDKVRRSQGAGSCSGPGPRHPGSRLRTRPHSGPEERDDPAPARPGAVPEGWAKQKVDESGRRAPGSRVCSPGAAAPGWVRAPVLAPRLAALPRSPRNLGPGAAPSTAPPRAARPRPPGAGGTVWPAPRQAPRWKEATAGV